MKKFLVSVMLLALLYPAALAQADPVQEFNVQLKDVKPDGRYTIVFTANSFDTSGEPPPLLTSNTVSFAAGVKIKPEFLSRAYQCDVTKLREALQSAPEDGYFFKRLDNLPATYKRVKDRLSPQDRKLVETCIRSQIGTGRVVVDARTLGIGDPLPAKLYLYLSKAQTKGSFASFGIFAVLDEAAPCGPGAREPRDAEARLRHGPLQRAERGRAVRLQDGPSDGVGPADQRRGAQGHRARDHQDDRQEDLPDEAQGQVREVQGHDDQAVLAGRSRPARPPARSRSARTTATRRAWPPRRRSRCPARASSRSRRPTGVHRPSTARGRPSSDRAGADDNPPMDAHGTWLCPEPLDRARFVDMERRMRPVRNLVFCAMGAGVAVLAAVWGWQVLALFGDRLAAGPDRRPPHLDQPDPRVLADGAHDRRHRRASAARSC